MTTIPTLVDVATQLHAATNTDVLADTINVTTQTPPFAEKFLRLLGWGKWVVYFVGVCALIGAGAIFAVEKYSERNDNKAMKIVLWVCVGAVIAAGATGIMDAATA
ncbi:hypothetical protein ACLQ3K_24810 [Tsukamurella sp. DT100]|uniref:hypothetical protein n=1 Tax=Tsukamurella sp. DT100 TaxID=3393415 RepID=UPI003CE800F4